MTPDRVVADRLLAHLRLERETPTLDYLDRIIREHQLRVPFETLTKLIDYEPGVRRGDFMPPIGEYVERIVERGAGGLCWTLARGLRFLLADLGFDASFMHMDPGHCCVRVELSTGPYYADVGYAAPIYRAYPLFESFSLDTHRERFEYSVREDGIFVARNPGPSKKLDPTPRRIEDLRGFITAANDWSAPQSFLHRLAYARDVGGVYTSFRDGMLTRYLPGGPEKNEVAAADVPGLLAGLFGADPTLYVEAAEVRRRYGRPLAG
ncbi:MAG TPA: arylamine N-acetyltransferase [Candidatus Eisenbacteria bacterium]|nr:arylamine N-acetyltransferase [Candidatus Eisenbacteria bacterium]